MCFAPQRHALLGHVNLQKCSEPGVLCTFWPRNVLRATAACTFSTSQLPKMVREWCALYILTWKSASRHNGVHFSTSQLEHCVLYILAWKCASRQNGVQLFSLIWTHGSAPAALASLLFDPPEPQIIGRTHCYATLLPFRAPAPFSSLIFSLLLFSSLTLPTSAFPSVHTVGCLTSKLPSTTHFVGYFAVLVPTCSPRLKAALNHTQEQPAPKDQQCSHIALVFSFYWE